jgi:hypothetical protein
MPGTPNLHRSSPKTTADAPSMIRVGRGSDRGAVASPNRRAAGEPVRAAAALDALSL